MHVSTKLLVPLLGGILFFFALALLVKVPISYNLRNLMVRWRITIMTGLAFTLVTALLTVMLAFVNGMYRLTEGSGQPGNVVVLSQGSTDEVMSSLSSPDVTDIERQKGVLSEDGQWMCSRERYLVVNQPVPGLAGKERKRRFLQLRGVDDPAMSGKVHGLSLKPGGAWFSEAGVQQSDKDKGESLIQAVVGEGIAREFGKDQGKESLQVDDEFVVGDRRWIITGILQSAGSTFDSEIWAKRSYIGPIFRKDDYSTLVLRTQDAEAAQTLAEYLSKHYTTASVKAMTELAYYDQLANTNRQFLGAILFVAAIMAVGGVFGIMNTMFAAISARTRDIGVLRILGFSRWQVLVSFFLESLLIALIGGAIGCALGYLANGISATSVASAGRGGGSKSLLLTVTVDANILSAGLLFSFFMGGLGGLLPALSAMRLKPLESLR